MKKQIIATILLLTMLSPFFVAAAASDYALLEVISVDDGGDVGWESRPRLLVHDSNADLMYATSYRFVSGVLEGRLLVIAPDSGELIDGITFDYGALYGLVVAADGSRVYVSRAPRAGRGYYGGAPSIRVFNTDPASPNYRTEIGPISTGGSSYGPDASAITPNGNWIYVTHRGSFVVHAINTSNNSVHNIPVPAGNSNGSQLSGIAVSPDGKRAYAVNRTNSTVVVIDTDPSSSTFNTVVEIISTTNGASNAGAAIGISPDGRFAYTTQNNNSSEVSVIDIDPSSTMFHTEVAKIAISGTRAQSVAVTADNLTLLVPNAVSDEVFVIDVDPNSPTFRTQVDAISLPSGSSPRIALVIKEGSAAGSIFVSLGDTSAIALIGVDNPNTPPTAMAGDDQSIRAGDTVVLDGSNSFDDNTDSLDLIYQWVLTAPLGSNAILSGDDTATPSFVADVVGTYNVLLEVTDEGGLTDTDEVMVSSDNLAPTAVATSDLAIYIVGDAVSLDGTGSSDPEGDELAFSWSHAAPAGSTSSISDPTSPLPTLLVDVVGTYDISLTVSDFIGPGTTDSVSIVATTAEDFAVIKVIESSDAVLVLEPGQVTTGGNQNALGNFFQQAIAAINNDDPATAIDKLEKARARTDGCIFNDPSMPDENGPGRDWVIDCAVQIELYGLLTDAIEALSPQ